MYVCIRILLAYMYKCTYACTYFLHQCAESWKAMTSQCRIDKLQSLLTRDVKDSIALKKVSV